MWQPLNGHVVWTGVRASPQDSRLLFDDEAAWCQPFPGLHARLTRPGVFFLASDPSTADRLLEVGHGVDG